MKNIAIAVLVAIAAMIPTAHAGEEIKQHDEILVSGGNIRCRSIEELETLINKKGTDIADLPTCHVVSAGEIGIVVAENKNVVRNGVDHVSSCIIFPSELKVATGGARCGWMITDKLRKIGTFRKEP